MILRVNAEIENDIAMAGIIDTETADWVLARLNPSARAIADYIIDNAWMLGDVVAHLRKANLPVNN